MMTRGSRRMHAAATAPRTWRFALAAGALLTLGGCATPRPVATPLRIADGIAVPAARGPVASDWASAVSAADEQTAAALADLRVLAAQLDELGRELDAWRASVEGKRRADFTSADTDRIGCLLFRWGVARDMVWERVRAQGAQVQPAAPPDAQMRSFLLGYAAAVAVQRHTARLVSGFLDAPVAAGKLNETHDRYDIPAGTYGSLVASVTSPDNRRALAELHAYVAEEATCPESALFRLVAADPDYAALVATADRAFEAADTDVARILKRKSILLPDTANRFRHNWLTETTRTLGRNIGDNLYLAQGVLFNSVSDIRRPMAPPADFTPDQVKLIRGLLQPGDLIFTFTAGYMSNVFLPGQFKHGITYVGSPEQRAAIGLVADVVRDVPPGRRAKLEQDLLTAKLATGYDADVIEAVAEGVILNSLDYLMKHHVNRMVVLRPRVNLEDRIQALGTTFLLLGGMYDFNFDFVDTSCQCCTEVIYRAFNGRGGISFALTRRMAVQTLSADDIIRSYLDADVPAFDLVVYAEEDAGSPIHLARCLTGEAARRRLAEVMEGETAGLPLLRLR